MPSPTGHAARLALAVLLCALAMTPVAGAAPRTTPHTGAASWTAQPAVSGSGTGGRPYVYLEGPPGTVLQDRISVTNSGRSPVTVRLSGADTYDEKGGGPGGGGATGTGRWLRTAATEVTVPARTRADVPFTVTVPTGATPGDRPAAIVVRGGDRTVGVPVRLRVGGPTLAALTVEDVTVSGRAIHYTLVNRGNAVLAPRLAVRADGVFGTLLRRGARTLPVEVRPGQRLRLTEPWDVPAFDSATVRLRVTAAGGAHGEATARAVFVPWAPLTAGALLVLAGAGAGAYAYRRRRSRRGQQRADTGTDPDIGAGAGERPGGSPGGQQDSGSRDLAKAGAES